MDPFTQAALGAVTARSVAPADMAKGVLATGAVLGAAPDIDILFSIGGDFFDNLIHHRGYTHSLIVLVAVGPLSGHWLWRRFGGGRRWRRQHLCWLAVATLALLSHPLLDWLTPYGTQLLLPLTDQRFAVNAMPIVDPLFSLILFAGLLAGAALETPRRRRVAALAALALSFGYLAYGWQQNLTAERLAEAQFAALRGAQTAGGAGLAVGDDYELRAFPTILQVHYRRIVIRSEDAVRVGYLSTWAPCAIEWGRAPSGDQRVGQVLRSTREGRIFDWFSMGWAYPFQQYRAAGLEAVFADLRYGATLDPKESFFSISAPFDAGQGLLAGPVGAWRGPNARNLDLRGLLAAAYAPECRAASGQIAKRWPQMHTKAGHGSALGATARLFSGRQETGGDR